MISSTWKIITGNFKEIFSIMKMVLVLSLLVSAIGLASKFIIFQSLTSVIVLSLVTFVASFMIGLVYTPAVFRTFQKKEFGENTTIAENIVFTKTHKWEFFCVMFWTGIMQAVYFIGAIIPLAVSFLLFKMIENISLIGGIVLLIVGGAGTVYLVLKMITKFVLTLNVYFATGKQPGESVRESMRLGTVYRTDVYNLYGRLIVVALFAFIINFCVGIVIGFTAHLVIPMIFSQLLIILLSTAIEILFVTPMIYILMSKTYVEIMKKEKEKESASAPVVPVIEQAVTPTIEEPKTI